MYITYYNCSSPYKYIVSNNRRFCIWNSTGKLTSNHDIGKNSTILSNSCVKMNHTPYPSMPKLCPFPNISFCRYCI